MSQLAQQTLTFASFVEQNNKTSNREALVIGCVEVGGGGCGAS